VIESRDNPRLVGILTAADFPRARLRDAVESPGTSFEPLER
jgi:hypothetical protein